MAALLSNASIERFQPDSAHHAGSVEIAKPVEFAGVFLGRELTQKDRRLSSGLAAIDNLLGGGIVRGRISEIVGGTSAGKTSLATCFVASATRRGETAAWVDSAGALDPAAVAASGVDLTRMLWAAFDPIAITSMLPTSLARRSPVKNILRAAELILEAGGFGLVVIDFGIYTRAIPASATLRVARLAERTGAAVIVLAARRMCGTFAAQCIALDRDRACFSRSAAGAPTIFDGLTIVSHMARNKLGGVGARADWHAMVDPSQGILSHFNRKESARSDGAIGRSGNSRQIASYRPQTPLRST